MDEGEHLERDDARATSDVGITIVEASSGRVVFQNGEAERIVGDTLAAPTARALRGETLRGERLRYRGTDGDRHTLRVDAAPVRDAEGNVVAAVTTFVEADAAKRDEGADEATLLARSVLMSVHEGLMVFDEFGRLRFANESASRILGVPVEDYAKGPSSSLPPLAFFDADGRPLEPFQTPAARALFERRPVIDVDIQVEHPRLGRRHLRVTAIYMPGRGVVASLLDVTAERATRETLEARVRERTRELEEALRDLETFTNSASHDLRAPLRGVASLAQELREAVKVHDEETAAELAARIELEGQRASRLVGDLLHFARSARQPLRPVLVDVSALAKDVIAAIHERHPRWTTSWDVAEGIEAYADAGLLRIALDNLLSNAAKYSSRAKDPRVSITGSMDEAGTTLRIADNGVGFPPGEAHRLFAPFQRLSTAQGYEGTGLGLATVHRIVARHGGELTATSRPGEGATFVARLPRRSDPPPP